MKRQFKIKGSWICIVAIILLMLPNILFFIGWVKGIWAVPCIIILGGGICSASFIISIRNTNYINIRMDALIGLLFGTGVIVWVCGIGGYFPQGSDWHVRNAIYRDLINYKWPVVYSETGYGLCYYIGFWLPAAYITKLFKVFGLSEWTVWNIGNAILYLWAYLCLVCVFFLLMVKSYRNKEIKGKDILIVLIVFICFGGQSIFGEKLAEAFGISDVGRLNNFWIEHWSSRVTVMNSNVTMLMNVFNQLIPAWIATLLFANLYDCYELFGLICFSLFISAPFPMVGLGILMLGILIFGIYKKNIKIDKIFSIPNLCSVVMVLVVGLYLGGNSSSSIVIRNILAPIEGMNAIVWLLIVFFLTYGGWSIVVFLVKRKWFVLLCAIMLILISTISMGGTIDFAMRASIPGGFILMYYILECLNEHTCSGVAGIARACIPIMLTISFMTVWICFMEVCGVAVAAGTLKCPTDAAVVYSFEGNVDEFDYPILNQYTIRDPENDIFFNKLCGVNNKYQYPIINKIADKDTGEIKIESITMHIKDSEDIIALISETEKVSASEQIEQQLKSNSDSGKVVFQRPLTMDKHIKVEDKDLDVEWLDYSNSCNISRGGIRVGHICITNNSEKVIAFSELADDKAGIGVYAKLTDSMGKVYFPVGFRKINRFMFPGESISLAIEFSTYVVEKPGKYVLEFGIYQKTENGQELESTWLETSNMHQYVIEFK